jgi:hypothetical protein
MLLLRLILLIESLANWKEWQHKQNFTYLYARRSYIVRASYSTQDARESLDISIHAKVSRVRLVEVQGLLEDDRKKTICRNFQQEACNIHSANV